MLTGLIIGALVTALVSLVLGGWLLALLGTEPAMAAVRSPSPRPRAVIHEFPARHLASSPPAATQRIAA